MSPQQPQISPQRRRAVFLVVAVALMMVVSAVSGLNVALPDLARETGASQSELQWIVDAYTLVFAGLLLLGGAVGDRYGRREVLLAGLLIFGGAATVALLVPEPAALVAARAAMGAGAALVMPTTLSIITTSFPEEERGRAVGAWAGIAGAGAVVGLLGSGLLLELFDWSSFFALNVALAAVAAAGAARVVPSSRDPQPPPLDPVAALLSLAAVAGLVFGIIEGPERGWGDGIVVAAIAAGTAALAAFVAWELRSPRPLLDPRLFARRGFGTASLSLTAQFFAAFGFFFIVLQYLQFVAGLSPLEAAAAMLPMPLVMIPLARRTPALADALGMNRVGAVGLTLIAAGLAVISFLQVDLDYALFAGGLVLFAAGMALAGPPATAALVAALPPEKQGVASAVNDVSREFGSALGIALLGSVLNESYRSGLEKALAGLPQPVAEHAQASIAWVQQAPLDQAGAAGLQLVSAAEAAFVEATSAAVAVAAVVLIVAAAVVALLGPRAASAADHREPRGRATTARVGTGRAA